MQLQALIKVLESGCTTNNRLRELEGLFEHIDSKRNIVLTALCTSRFLFFLISVFLHFFNLLNQNIPLVYMSPGQSTWCGEPPYLRGGMQMLIFARIFLGVHYIYLSLDYFVWSSWIRNDSLVTGDIRSNTLISIFLFSLSYCFCLIVLPN